MEPLDQRLEVRLPQQLMDALDAIRLSVNSPHKLTRSDVVRMFIDQGIDRMKGTSENVPEEISLGDRLNLFFHMEMLTQAGPGAVRTVQAHNKYGRDKPSKFEVIKKVYLKRYFWLFELDAPSLTLIDSSLQGDDIAALINKTSNLGSVQSLKFAANVVRMFSDIRGCLEQNSNNIESTEIIATLSARNSIPLHFRGFPADNSILNEMAGLVGWIDGDYGSPAKMNNDVYEMDTYHRMLSVYNDALDGQRHITIESLRDMMLDRRLS